LEQRLKAVPQAEQGEYSTVGRDRSPHQAHRAGDKRTSRAQLHETKCAVEAKSKLDALEQRLKAAPGTIKSSTNSNFPRELHTSI
jgi:hypothetical protein